MTFPDEQNQKIQQQVEMRLRERENRTPDSEVPLYKTIKHQTENFPRPEMKKVILGLKLFAIGVAVLVAVRLATILAGFIITATLVWIVYNLFLASRK